MNGCITILKLGVYSSEVNWFLMKKTLSNGTKLLVVNTSIREIKN